jgi:hypothetical protein
VIAAAAAAVFVFPHGYVNGQAWYIGSVPDTPLAPPNFKGNADRYARLLTTMMALLAYSTRLRKNKASNWSGVAKRTCAVVSIALIFLMIEGVRTSRMTEIYEPVDTGVGLWLIPTFVYSALVG